MSSGTSERRSITSALMPWSLASRSAASSRARHHRRERDDRCSRCPPEHARRAELVDELSVGHLALVGEQRLVLAEDDRVGVADGGGQEALRRRPASTARRPSGPGWPSPSSRRSGSAARRSAGRRRSRCAARAAATPGRRSCSGSWRSGWRPCPRRRAKKSENMSSPMGRRPVIAAPITAPTMACSLIGVSRTRSGPNRVEQPLGRLEDAAGRADVLADEHDRRVALHLLGDAAATAAR